MKAKTHVLQDKTVSKQRHLYYMTKHVTRKDTLLDKTQNNVSKHT